MQTVMTAKEIEEVREEGRQAGYQEGYEEGFEAGEEAGLDCTLIGKVVNNNIPGWNVVVETAPNCTLPIGTCVYLCTPSVDLKDSFECKAYMHLRDTANKEEIDWVLLSGCTPQEIDIRMKSIIKDIYPDPGFTPE